jgi:hypothetical protein
LAAGYGQPQELRVHNLGSLVKDHTAYWSNRDEFVSCVVADLVLAATLGLDKIQLGDVTPVDSTMMEFARQRRIWRVSKLLWMRRIGAVAGFGILALQFLWIVSLGEIVKRLFRELPSPLMSRLPQVPDVLAAPAIVGAVTAILGIWIIYTVGVWGWRAWERREAAFFFSRSSFRTGGWGISLFALVVATLITVCALAWSSAIPLSWSYVIFAMLLAVPFLSRGPGREAAWGEKVLGLGQELLQRGVDPEEKEPVLHLIKACTCFALVIRRIASRRLNSSICEPALKGCGEALRNVPTAILEQLLDTYDTLIAEADSRGINTVAAKETASALRMRLGAGFQAV